MYIYDNHSLILCQYYVYLSMYLCSNVHDKLIGTIAYTMVSMFVKNQGKNRVIQQFIPTML